MWREEAAGRGSRPRSEQATVGWHGCGAASVGMEMSDMPAYMGTHWGQVPWLMPGGVHGDSTGLGEYKMVHRGTRDIARCSPGPVGPKVTQVRNLLRPWSLALGQREISVLFHMPRLGRPQGVSSEAEGG